MLEATIVLQVVIGERVEGLMIVALLLLNVALGVFQETRANATLELLKQRLTPRVRVRRDGMWTDPPAVDVVPGDIVQLSLGGIVPADLRILTGTVLLDQSMLTGESIAADIGPEGTGYAGALVRRGEAIGEVSLLDPAPSSDAPPSWCGSLMSRAASRRPLSAWSRPSRSSIS